MTREEKDSLQQCASLALANLIENKIKSVERIPRV